MAAMAGYCTRYLPSERDNMKRRRRVKPPRAPWTPEEDAKLREVNEIGLRVEYWQLALPHRLESEMLLRRYDLGIKPARDI